MMSARELDEAILQLTEDARDLGTARRAVLNSEFGRRLVPYLLEMRGKLNAQGSRSGDLGWQGWVEARKGLFGSVRTVNRWLRKAREA